MSEIFQMTDEDLLQLVKNGDSLDNTKHVKLSDLSDTELLKKLTKSDYSIFNEIYKRYWTKLYIYAYNVLRDKDVCEDIIQEIFTDLWLRRKKVKIEKLSAYLFKSVKFQMAKYISKNKLSEYLTEQLDWVLLEESLEAYIDYNDLNEGIKKLLNQLPEKRREIFYMSRFENMKNQEIADKLNISIQTVKNQITESLKYLRLSRHALLLFMLFTFLSR